MRLFDTERNRLAVFVKEVGIKARDPENELLAVGLLNSSREILVALLRLIFCPYHLTSFLFLRPKYPSLLQETFLGCILIFSGPTSLT